LLHWEGLKVVDPTAPEGEAEELQTPPVDSDRDFRKMSKAEMNAYTRGIKEGIMTSIDDATNRDKLLQDGQKSMIDYIMLAPENIRPSSAWKEKDYGAVRGMDIE